MFPQIKGANIGGLSELVAKEARREKTCRTRNVI
jgi:hypothetical protein